jgi:16S rRNA (adenine1518-N6/adenine1519-N6)-dimethyltransferase
MSRSKQRRMGQNFLVDDEVAERIVALLDDEPGRVVEIGPGRGALTRPLAARFKRVLALELDRELAAGLSASGPPASVEVVHGDALHDPLEPLVEGEAPWQVAANLPYSVGSAILRRLLPRHDLFTVLVVMLQREVAERVVASPGGRNHGLMALERSAWAEASVAFEVPPRAFRPRPKVMSAVVVLRLRPAPVDLAALERGLRLAAHALTRPRKMLGNALRPLGDRDAIAAAGLDPDLRPGKLSLKDWVRLAQAVTI